MACDAVGKTIKKIRATQKNTADDYKAEKVMFVIITDGLENASREYTAERVKARIKRQKEKYGWESVYYGACKSYNARSNHNRRKTKMRR